MTIVRDVKFLMDAKRLAKERGAVTAGNYFVPDHSRDTIYGPGSRLFMVHFFNRDGVEVAYWIPDMESLHTFETPREWHQSVKDTLRFYHLEEA